jgi:hypothetical protein
MSVIEISNDHVVAIADGEEAVIISDGEEVVLVQGL